MSIKPRTRLDARPFTIDEARQLISSAINDHVGNDVDELLLSILQQGGPILTGDAPSIQAYVRAIGFGEAYAYGVRDGYLGADSPARIAATMIVTGDLAQSYANGLAVGRALAGDEDPDLEEFGQAYDADEYDLLGSWPREIEARLTLAPVVPTSLPTDEDPEEERCEIERAMEHVAEIDFVETPAPLPILPTDPVVGAVGGEEPELEARA